MVVVVVGEEALDGEGRARDGRGTGEETGQTNRDKARQGEVKGTLVGGTKQNSDLDSRRVRAKSWGAAAGSRCGSVGQPGSLSRKDGRKTRRRALEG